MNEFKYADEPQDDNDTVCSNFSDVDMGMYPCLVSNSPIQPHPQTPSVSSLSKESPPTNSQKMPPTPRPALIPASDDPSDSPFYHPHTPAANIDHTTNLLDFTQQFEAVSRPNFTSGSNQRHQHAKSTTPTNEIGNPSSPTPDESRIFNLLDFSPGPIATPRSIPSITPREVDELKAGLNAQINLLKVQLDGRDVEIAALRSAMEVTEAHRTELSNSHKELQMGFEGERLEWQRIKLELDAHLEAEKSEKEAISTILTEKDQIVKHLYIDLEKSNAEVNMLKQRLRDVEDDLDRTRTEILRVKEDVATTTASSLITPQLELTNTQAEVEKVARELHSLYKAKHETKVAALKKSYEGRWEKKVIALQDKIEEITKKNQELINLVEESKATVRERKAEDMTPGVSFAVPPQGAACSLDEQDLRRRIQELTDELENEKHEKEGIVALVEELLSIQSTAPPEQVKEKMKGSVRRASGIGALGRVSKLQNAVKKTGMDLSDD